VRTLEVEAFLAANALQDPLSGYAADFEAYARSQHGWSGRILVLPSQGGQPRRSGDRTTIGPTNAISETATATSMAGRLQQVALRYASDTGARVTILDGLGSALADSAYPTSTVLNQFGQSEFQAAIRGQVRQAVRFDPLSRAVTLYVAAPIRRGDLILGVVQLGQPVTTITAGARSLLLRLAAFGSWPC